jgi:hypothetical protein
MATTSLNYHHLRNLDRFHLGTPRNTIWMGTGSRDLPPPVRGIQEVLYGSGPGCPGPRGILTEQYKQSLKKKSAVADVQTNIKPAALVNTGLYKRTKPGDPFGYLNDH